MSSHAFRLQQPTSASKEFPPFSVTRKKHLAKRKKITVRIPPRAFSICALPKSAIHALREPKTFLSFILEAPASSRPGQDVCFLEEFRARCYNRSLIRTEVALLGRMRRSHCILDSGPLGCFSNITHILRQRCDGRSECRVFVSSLGQYIGNCSRTLMSYLYAHYTCERGLFCRVREGNMKSG